SMESYSYGNDTVYDLTDDLKKLVSLGEPDFYRNDIKLNGKIYSLSFIKKDKFLDYLRLFDNRPYSEYEFRDFVALTPEWFKDRATEFTADDSEAAAMYIDFKEKYGVDKLSTLSGEDLLKTLFLGASTDNLCHELEY